MRTTNTPSRAQRLAPSGCVRRSHGRIRLRDAHARPVAFFVGQILFTDVDPHEHQGPIESIVSVGVVGTLALVLGIGMGLSFAAPSPASARRRAPSSPHWRSSPSRRSPSALPASSACAAWLGGLTLKLEPQTSAARYAGILGAFVALLDVVLTLAVRDHRPPRPDAARPALDASADKPFPHVASTAHSRRPPRLPTSHLSPTAPPTSPGDPDEDHDHLHWPSRPPCG